MKNNLTIIIAHFKLRDNNINPLIKTLEIIEQQKSNFNIEIIIADDGSFYSKELSINYSKKINFKNDNRELFIIENGKLKDWIKTLNIKTDNIKKWIYLPKIKSCMSKSKLLNYATKLSKYDHLLFLDDDNYFISENTIKNILQLFKKYDIIFGQIKDNSNRLRKYSSKRVQGTTFGLKKKIIEEIDGFGEWTENISCGFDSDLWIRLFKYYNKNKKIRVCYTNQISTFDSYSGRWKKYTKLFKEFSVRKEFLKHHGIKKYKNPRFNLSRNKKIWMDNLIDLNG